MAQGNSASWLVPLVAGCLDMPEKDLDPRAALTQYGLDSLSIAELTAAIEDRAGLSVPEWLLLDCPTLESIDRFLCRNASVPNPTQERRVAPPPVRQMVADGALPAGSDLAVFRIKGGGAEFPAALVSGLDPSTDLGLGITIQSHRVVDGALEFTVSTAEEAVLRANSPIRVVFGDGSVWHGLLFPVTAAYVRSS